MKINTATTLVLLLLLTTGCGTSYIPSSVNSPMFSNKGEFQGAIHM